MGSKSSGTELPSRLHHPKTLPEELDSSGEEKLHNIRSGKRGGPKVAETNNILKGNKPYVEQGTICGPGA